MSCFKGINTAQTTGWTGTMQLHLLDMHPLPKTCKGHYNVVMKGNLVLKLANI